ncbi:DEAD/DEAH box helicase family protein [uncultured Flavobacterium sp.]|uniref:DEAD/DEAH box helicase family protein n=1 Tax=uncultured Flavobacterium sp. TaxID=165435 RepID=UPI0025D23D54|nr:DEAD/DEAH box helicase family protein [uncultured Flavobacterium sp.]
MNQIEKTALTDINKIDTFQKVMEKLTIGSELNHEEIVYILGCAIIFLKHYEQDNRYTSYAEFAYYIVLKYSTKYNDYAPLYDFSTNFGYYPVAKAILDDDLLSEGSIEDCFIGIELERYRHEEYIETVHQFNSKRQLLTDEALEVSYIAPTSFGKSSVIVDYIKKYTNSNNRIGIIVPTKSLLMQTYRMIRNANLGKKIIIHDEMFQGQDSFIAVFTQERALRLLSKNNIHFNILFIDEAHNILKDDPRSILLSRLLAKNRGLNPNQNVIYLSPLIEDAHSLKIAQEQSINQHKIPFNIKEPEIYEFCTDGNVTKYNRFVNEQYHIGQFKDMFDYINSTSATKNFLYNYRPVSIELAAKVLAKHLPELVNSEPINNLIKILKQEVHEKFYAVDYLKHGVVYLHGKLPDLIKEYLESKFKNLVEIKYIIANSVILEGMNLPIDNLYILNTYSLGGKELTNLIGRVNRLNTIFSQSKNDLSKLLPTVHFINSELFNRKDGKMAAKIGLLRSRIFKDVIHNPTLDTFDLNKLTKSERERKKTLYDQVREDESFLTKIPQTSFERVKQYLIESGISHFYEDLHTICQILDKRLENIKINPVWNTLDMLGKINYVFINNVDVKDAEFKRLQYPQARTYYDYHITVNQKKALKENVNHMFNYFKKRIKDKNPLTFFGKTYGEVGRTEDPKEAKLYVNLSKKNDTEMINLAIIKLKMEDDFISFKLNKFIIMLYDYKLISLDDYNKYIYGTTNQYKIDLSKIGLSVSLISRLEADNQLQYLYFDDYNNLRSRPEFENYKNSVDDFYRFEIERFLN